MMRSEPHSYSLDGTRFEGAWVWDDTTSQDRLPF